MTHARGGGCRYRDGMLAMVLTATSPIGTKPLRFATFPDPSPGPGEVLIRVGACAACRTDLQIAEGDLRARTMPIVLGHQVAGRIEGLGEGVTDWAEGDRAGLTWLAGSCGDCAHCQAGRENLCVQATFTGWDRHGGFAEMVTARADVVVPLPDGPDDRHLAPLLCGGVIGFRALRVAGVTPGSRVGLYGFGASALQAIQVARHWGCRVAVATRSDEGRSRALEMGAEWVGGYDDAPPFPLDAAVTFAPSGDVVVAALRALERGGQRHSPRSHPTVQLRRPVVGAIDTQRRQRHPRRCPRLSGDRRADPGTYSGGGVRTSRCKPGPKAHRVGRGAGCRGHHSLIAVPRGPAVRPRGRAVIRIRQ